MTSYLRMHDSSSVQTSGGKAAALSALVSQGFNVPPFFVLTEKAFLAEGLATDSLEKLPVFMAELGQGPFAVRSSGREEDGNSHSHAGQFSTFLNIAPEDVAKSAHQVRLSGEADSVQHYRQSRGIACDGGKPAVIIQKMVSARVAGICFTADPVSGRQERIVISAIAGLGDRLVGGEEDGLTYVIDAKTQSIINEPQAETLLTQNDIQLLVKLALDVQRVQGSPQDIEWAFEGDTLYLLQSRPITTTLRAPGLTDPKVTVFDNSNIIESYPGLVTPLTYSFAQYAYARVYRMFVAMIGVSQTTIRANAVVFDNMLGRINGRIYYNLINWYRLISLLPGYANNRSHMETMMGVGEPLPSALQDDIAPKPLRGWRHVVDYGRIVKMAGLLLWQAVIFPVTRRNYYKRLERALKTDAASINSMPLTELAAEYRRIEAELLDRWDAPLVNDFLCMMAFGGSRKLIERWAGQQGVQLHNAVMIGQGDIISAEPAKRIARMGDIARGNTVLIKRLEEADKTLIDGNDALASELKAYLAKFGDRCTEELKLESITLHEDPAQLLLAVAAAAKSNPEVSKDKKTDTLTDLADLFKGHSFRYRIMRFFLLYAKNRVRDRENLRFERTRIFGHARRVLLATGQQFYANGFIDTPRDVFFLTIGEILGAIEGFGGSSDLRGLISVRRKEMEQAAAQPDAPERITITGAVINGINLETTQTSVSSDTDPVFTRTATGCSAGIVRGIARVISDPHTQALAQGEILVSHHTDPGWIAVFSNAAAIIVERGSLLSHSAIVSREMGIPCVVGLKGATQWITDGEMIEVDGAAGIVRKINE